MHYEIKLRCPICKSERVNQYREPTGKIWCDGCGFSAAHKEIENPFVVKMKVEPAWLQELDKVSQVKQTQESLQSQLQKLYTIANKFGLYDAADFISRHIVD